ncbi:NAD(P)/FAD-dependent oxidoreductase [Pseudomonas sp. JQ170]|uniref:NAD(P)/FAD-dependent oxidoreductase n=1 Tax=unclassified Pseudomonas TaxID=196821 RepID=UPI0026568DD6|nr:MULTISPECIES: NAD(P)/FAD-dependent oxidoreductase [unclassified Pseudomonas]MDN7143701.1 NAD(P)/FAD-dependent oxidoreductase [Pseudomonas sp. JQ170]WRO74130.1 NAD(P)/FAD-dependent oxidoreductase [Pseudomonas sp. 170C]
MNTATTSTDYLVIGAGATAMAFVDTLLDESDANVVMVDRHAQPGGHWNDAYSFVRLHQPSAFYGVNSRELGSGLKDESEWGEGMYELASGAEIVSYFDQLMQQRFLPSGRVHYFPMHNYEGDRSSQHCITSLLTGDSNAIQVRRKLVDATIAQTAVPSTHAPRYQIASGVRCVPLNDLPRIEKPHSRYVVVGGGKTAIDACLWLLQNGVAANRIQWIVPNAFWLLDRANVQPGPENFVRTIGSLANQFEAIGAADSLADLFLRLERAGELLRIDTTVEPTGFRGATVSQGELRALRSINDVVRLGRVHAIEANRVVLERGSIAAGIDALYIDCSASAIPIIPEGSVKAFDGNRINVVTVSSYQILFSAALIAYVESHLDDQVRMNQLCGVVPAPRSSADWLRMWAVYLDNQRQWKHDAGLSRWLAQCHLHLLPSVLRSLQEGDPAKLAVLNRFAEARKKAFVNLPRLLQEVMQFQRMENSQRE